MMKLLSDFADHGVRTWGAALLVCAAATLPACGPAPRTQDQPGADAGNDSQNQVLDVTLEPPATREQGFQLTIPPFSLMAGQELQQCFFFTINYDTPIFIDHFEIAQTTGTHHMNIFRVRTVKNLDGADGTSVVDGECWKPANWSDWPLVVNSQNEGHVDVQLPDGVAHRFEPGEKIMLQTHYVNASTQQTPGGFGKVLVNFNRIDASLVHAELGTAFATNQNIRICPGDVERRFETTCRFAQDNPVTIFGANGHFHSRGRLFTMSVFDPTLGTGQQFYENTEWNEPLFARDIGVAVPIQGGISYACEYTVLPTECGDPNDGCCFTFGGHVDAQEHCNAFVYYYPRNATTDVNCF